MFPKTIHGFSVEEKTYWCSWEPEGFLLTDRWTLCVPELGLYEKVGEPASPCLFKHEGSGWFKKVSFWETRNEIIRMVLYDGLWPVATPETGAVWHDENGVPYHILGSVPGYPVLRVLQSSRAARVVQGGPFLHLTSEWYETILF